VSHTKAVSIITTAATSLIAIILLTLFLALNPGHSLRVRSAWSEWYLNPTAEKKKDLDLVVLRVNREYNLYRLGLIIFLSVDSYVIYRSFVSRKRTTQT
jgi:hypothetical protein